jgi:hypothetical protein
VLFGTGVQAFLEVRKSSLSGAGLGVFLHSTAPVAEGTVLTQYGGEDLPAHLVASTEYAISIPGTARSLFHVGEPWAGPVSRQCTGLSRRVTGGVGRRVVGLT